jgi:hypothetical protein
VLVRPDYIASRIVNANHIITRSTVEFRLAGRIADCVRGLSVNKPRTRILFVRLFAWGVNGRPAARRCEKELHTRRRIV